MMDLMFPPLQVDDLVRIAKPKRTGSVPCPGGVRRGTPNEGA